jgi:NADH:ubiquinone oxidoreductase subunit F (NADH-binding)
MLDVRMDFENLKENAAALGSGAVLVMDEDSDMADMLFSILKFFAHESCGQCAPCRLGTHQLVQYAYQLRQGQGQTGDLEKMLNIVEAMRSISLCPLGQSPIMPVKSAIKNFRAEFEAKLINK